MHLFVCLLITETNHKEEKKKNHYIFFVCSDLEMPKIQQQDILCAVVKATLWNDDVGGHQVQLQVENFLCFNHIH